MLLGFLVLFLVPALADVFDLFYEPLYIAHILFSRLIVFEGVVHDSSLQFTIAVLLAASAATATSLLSYSIESIHLELLVSLEQSANEGVDLPQSPPQNRVELVLDIIFRP